MKSAFTKQNSKILLGFSLTASIESETAIRLTHDYVTLSCFNTKPRFQRVIPCRFASVNTPITANHKNSHVTKVKVLTCRKMILQKRGLVLKFWTLTA